VLTALLPSSMSENPSIRSLSSSSENFSLLLQSAVPNTRKSVSGFGALDLLHRTVERCPDIRRCLANIVPVTTFGNDEVVDLGAKRRIRLTIDFLCLSGFFVPGVGNPLEEKEWRDVALPVSPVDG
jgi:hypothetical protein